jgi:hypothetical protein
MRKSLLIPSSLTSESADRRIRTYKVGQIARAAAIFRVDRVIIYRDNEFDDSGFIALILRYMETPQYLRKRLFPLCEDLRYAGVLPPLRTPHHPTSSKMSGLRIGEFREGVVDGEKVDIGVERPAKLDSRLDPRGRRITTRVTSLNPLTIETVDREAIPVYWGYDVRMGDMLGKTLSGLSKMDRSSEGGSKRPSGTRSNSEIVFTSRKGSILDEEKLRELSGKDIAFVFGSPDRGVGEILGDENLSTRDFSSYVLNTIPGQGTKTVRTEEAVFATLAIFNLMCTT